MAGMTKVTKEEIAEAGLTGWTYLLGALHTRIRTGDFAAGLALLNAIGAEAERMDHHPDVDLRYGHLDVRLVSHDVGAVTGRDVGLARAVTRLAGEAGLTPGFAGLARLELALDTPSPGKVRPFWAAVLGMREGEDLTDAAGVLPSVWFQESGSDEPRQRWHPDVWVDPAEVQPRIDAALAAGGTVASDAEAPSFWVLADPEGNRVCLCTWQDRG